MATITTIIIIIATTGHAFACFRATIITIIIITTTTTAITANAAEQAVSGRVLAGTAFRCAQQIAIGAVEYGVGI